jgi:hypothetical protein
MFLFIFLSRVIIIHRLKTAHLNIDELSSLASELTNTTKLIDNAEFRICKIFKIAKDVEILLIVEISLSMTIVEDTRDFLRRVAIELLNDNVFKKIHDYLQNQVQRISTEDMSFNTTYQFYRIDSNSELLYLISRFDSNKLCILKTL